MPRLFKATNAVLALICAMYFITYIDRVNISTAASAIQTELKLTNTQLGLVFSAFGYPYLIFQIVGGWVADRFGPRMTLFACGVVWATSTVLIGFSGGLVSLVAARLLLGLGEGATFPTATRAMQSWTPAASRGFVQGITHAFARIGNSITPLLVVALMAAYTWRGSFIVLGLASFIWVALWGWYFRNEPGEHPGVTAAELAKLPAAPTARRLAAPWSRLIWKMAPVTLTYFCYGWCLNLYLSWLPLFFKNTFSLDIKSSAVFSTGVFIAGVLGDMVGGVLSDRIYKSTQNVRFARLSVTIFGFLGALACLLPMIWVHDITVVALCLSGGFFCAELVIGPMWAIPMDIAPKYSGTASGLMNSGTALAVIVSPLAAGLMIDATGNWYLPFYMLMGVLALGAVGALFMHPERPLEGAA